MEKRVPQNKAAAELDKFKRRLIRAVARLLIDEKTPEDQLWQTLKKETGCDCELLWMRMRSVTVKKLDRLLASNDCMDTLPKAAKMSLTDWLLFDLVLVHQKIDLIGEDIPGKENEDRPVLVELLDLVKMFRIEYLRGEDLAEAWSSATLYYNKKGHHCSPMLLQRRWYQLKVMVRLKFYEFWYAYRGNNARIIYAQPYRPTPLEIEVARTFKLVILQPFREWDELIQDRLVILPAEFEAKMKEKCGLKKPKPKPSEDLPDVVMIEPRIETIDLRLEPDVNLTDENSKEDDNPPPPLVRIKQEPRDPEEMNAEETQIELPKKSIYEVVLESTHLENEQLDKMQLELQDGDFDSYDNEMEEHEETIESTMGDEDQSLLPQITSVFGNVSDTSVLANIDETRVYRTVESTNTSGHSDNTNVTGDEKNTGLNSTVDDTIVLDNSNDIIDCDDLAENSSGDEKDTGACDNVDENSAQGIDKDTAFDNLVRNGARDNSKDTGMFSTIDKETDICANVEDASDNIDNGSVNYGDASANTEVVSSNIRDDGANVRDVSANVDDASANVGNNSAFVGNVSVNIGRVSSNEEDVTANVGDVSPNVEAVSANVGDVSANIRKSGPDNFDREHDINEISDDGDISGNVDKTSVISSAVKTCVTGNVVERREIAVNANVTNTDILNAKSPNTDNKAVTNKTELIKDVDDTLQSIVITDSDDDNQGFEDDIIICNKSQPKGTIITEGVIGPKNTTDQPMEIDSTPPVIKVSFTEPSKVTVENKDVMTEKVKGYLRPSVKSFTFGELSNNISFADEGIELVDDSILYVDGDRHKEKEVKNKIRDEEETDEVPKIDEKLLMCPIIYTTRLDDMNLFRTQPFDHVNDKLLLDTIALKSKPTLNDIYNDSSKTIECVEENVSCKPNNNASVDARSDLAMNVPIIDNSIKMRIEPLNKIVENVSEDKFSIVHQEKEIISIEKLMPENVDNVTSDDDDCDENVIDESQKVKPTSYLLQKPRSRKYNPIQLCKNPDFNTRLKRLNVRFFSSLRNRVLIKSCKPLTIDLSKAFESKLISGTLYLKPSDHNVVQEIIDDTRSQNVSVIPSAMPAQSLINNSKVADILPMLRHETSKPPEDLGSTIERNKVINLPDITEIRRINQRLLTAEVTPIQVQNNLPQVPVTIVTSVNTPTYPPPKTIPISQTIEDLRAEATDIRGPPKLLDITDDLPAKTSSEHYSSKERNTIDVERSKSIIGRPSKTLNAKRLFPTKPVVWKPREIRPDIPWLSKNHDPVINSKKIEETLLTLDALNKMIFLLTDEHEPDSIPKKPKLKGKKLKDGAQQAKQQRGKIVKSSKSARIDECSCKERENKEPSKENDETSGEQTIKCPKINIRPAENYPPSLLYYPNTRSKPEDVDTNVSQKTTQYCCWARQRMLQLLFCRDRIPPHDCPKICECCCKNLLRDYSLHDQKIKKTELQIIKNTVEYSASLLKANMIDAGTFSYKKPVETVVKNPVETVVQNPVEIVIHNPVEIVIRNSVKNVGHDTVGTLVETSSQIPVIDTVQLPDEKSILVPDEKAVANVETTEPITCITENEPIDLEAMDIGGNVPVLGGEVSVKTTAVVPTLTVERLETPVNAIPGHSNVFPVSIPVLQKPKLISCHCVNHDKVAQKYTYTHSVSADKLSGGLILNSVTKATPITQPSLRQVLELKKANNVLKRQKTKMPPPPKRNNPHFAAKRMKQRMIYVNSKRFTDKPTSLPVFLGKNKILLTTAKFPPNLKLFRKAKEALRASLKIPNGVHIICLPNGTISYHIDRNVVVKATQLAEMPALIAAVQAYMAVHAEQDEPVIKKTVYPTPVVMGSEVVNLVDDDDECDPNVCESENNKTAIVTEDQTTEKNVTIHSVDSINDIFNSQMKSSNEIEDNRVEANVNGSLIAAEAEKTQDEDANKNINTIIGTQEDIQEPNQHIMPSVLTEQVQGHPDLTPPYENVSADVNSLPKPSSHTENTVIQEVLVEQRQDRPHMTPPDHKVSADVNSLPKPSSHTESTDIQEVLAEKVQDHSDLTSPDESVSAVVNGLPKPSSDTESTDIQKVLAEKVHDRSDLTSPDESVSAVVNGLPKPSSDTENTVIQEVLAEQGQDRPHLTPPDQKVSADVNSLPKPSSHTESTDIQEELAEQVQDQSDPSRYNVSTELQNQPEQTAQNVSTAVPEDSSSEPRNKTKNILSDLMEMSGIFDEDMTPAIEGTAPAQPAQVVTLAQPILMTPAIDGTVPAQSAQSVSFSQPLLVRALSVPHVSPPALAPLTTVPVRPMTYPSLVKRNYVPKLLKSTIGNLTPITSLYELKYACATRGTFFKLDFETGLIVPINVCMKQTITNEGEPAPQNVPIAPKSVIDLTDDDGKSEQKDTEPNTSPGKRSLLLVNNVTSGTNANALKNFSGPVKPVKLFKALKPSILQRLDMHKANRERKNTNKKSTVDHTIKRKQFLRKINLNSADPDYMTVNVPKRIYERKLTVNRDLISLYKLDKRPKTTCKEPTKLLEITILSDDDSDDEPLAKKAKRKRDNLNATEQKANAPGNAEASEDNATSPELVTKDIELEVEKDLKEPETPTAKEIASELPVAHTDNDKMSDNDIIEIDAPDFDLGDSNDDSQDCILGF